MNVSNLPTNTFSVSNAINEATPILAGIPGTVSEELGNRTYTIIMWSTSMTAFTGDGE